MSDLQQNGMAVGMVGIKYLLPALAHHGRMDMAMGLITETQYPSLGRRGWVIGWLAGWLSDKLND